MSKVNLDRRLDAKVAHMAPVRDALDDTAAEVLATAKTLAGPHARTGKYAASLRIEHGKLDAHVVAGDDAVDYAAAVEFGHHSRDGEWRDGEHILGRAARSVGQ